MLLIKIQTERYLMLLKIRENGGERGGGERERGRQTGTGRQTDRQQQRQRKRVCMLWKIVMRPT